MSFISKILENDLLRSKLNFWRSVSLVFIIVVVLSQHFNRNGLPNFLSSNYVAKININGFISGNDEYIDFLKRLQKNKRVSSVILRINSPGGSLVGSENVYNAVMSLSKVKPVVAVLGDFATSGGYMVAVASNYIVSRPASVTGSVGVVFQYYGFYDLAKKLGIELKSFKSSKYKASPSPFEKLEKGKSDIKQAMNSVINSAYNHFVSIVKERRPNLKNPYIALSGRIFLGLDAIKFGMVDEIGDEENAIKWLNNKKINTKNVRNIVFKPTNTEGNSTLVGLVSSYLLKDTGNKLKETAGLLAINSSIK